MTTLTTRTAALDVQHLLAQVKRSIRGTALGPVAGIVAAILALLLAGGMLVQLLLAPGAAEATTAAPDDVAQVQPAAAQAAASTASPELALTPGLRTLDVAVPAGQAVTYELPVIDVGSLIADVRAADAEVIAQIPGGEVSGPGTIVALDVPEDAATVMVTIQSTSDSPQDVRLSLQTTRAQSDDVAAWG